MICEQCKRGASFYRIGVGWFWGRKILLHFNNCMDTWIWANCE